MILIPLLAFLVRPLKRRWQRRQEERAAQEGVGVA
jgi:hypothetical protein